MPAVGPGLVSAGQGADLDQVVGQDSVSGPGPGAFGAVQAGAVPPVLALESADPAFASGPPLDGFALARDDDVADPEGEQVVFDGFLAVAAVGGDGPGCLAGPLDDASYGGGELRGIGRVALLHGIVQDDAVVVVGDLG